MHLNLLRHRVPASSWDGETKKNKINLYIVKMCLSGLLCINIVIWDLKKIFWALEKPQNLACYLLTVVRCVMLHRQLKIILPIVLEGIAKGKVSLNVICSCWTINIKKMQWYKILNMYVHMNLIGSSRITAKKFTPFPKKMSWWCPCKDIVIYKLHCHWRLKAMKKL